MRQLFAFVLSILFAWGVALQDFQLRERDAPVCAGQPLRRMIRVRSLGKPV